MLAQPIFFERMGPSLRMQQKNKSTESQTLPEHIIFSHILPFLHFKTLVRFKSVAKSWRKLISDDPLFALHQSRHISPISCGAVFAGCHGRSLVFFPTFGSPIGIPNPSLDFVPGGNCQRIFASANGLLCLQCYGRLHCHNDSGRFFYICNPATEEGHTVADKGTNGSRNLIGLAFDPRISTECYKLVHPLRRPRQVLNHLGVAYGFEVFSSDTNKWVESSQEIRDISELWNHRKAVCVSGVVYWDCQTYLLSFDPWKDVAGYVRLPEHLGRCSRHEIGVYNDRMMTYTMIDGRNFEVWMLSGHDEKMWEMKYSVKVDEMIEANPDVFPKFCHATRRRSSDIVLLDSSVRPFPFEGGEKLHFMFDKSRRRDKENVVLSYDLKTRKVVELCVFNPNIMSREMDEIVFSYHNSMVRVPKLGS